MKKTTILLVVLIIGLHIKAQWVASFGPEGTPVSQVIYFKKALIVKTGNQSFYKSSDNGDNWEKMVFSGISLSDNKDLTMVSTANNLFAYHDANIYYSNDKGETWQARDNGITTPYYGGTLVSSKGNLYLSSYLTNDAFESTDEGATWNKLGRDGLGSSDSFSEGIFNVGTNLVGPEHGSGAYYSTDGGSNWIKSEGLPSSIDYIVEVDGKIYTCSSNNGIYESSDQGANWTKIISHPSIKLLFEEQGNLFAGTYSDSTYLVDVTNKSLVPYTKMGAFPNDIESDGSSMWFGASNRGFHRSGNSGNTWAMANKGLGFARPLAFGHIDDTYFCIGGGGLWKTNTLGVRWVPTTITDDYFIDMLVVGTDIYACSENTVKVTSDQGKAWSVVGTNYPDDISSPSLGMHDGDLYMFAQQGSNSGLYRLAGFTGSWAKVTNAPTGGGAFDVVGDTIYVAKKYSVDGGSSWKSISGINGLGITYKAIKTNGVTYMGTNPFNQEPVYKSADGVSFNSFTNGLPSKCGSLWPEVVKGDTVFAVILDDATNATRERSVYFTASSMSQWNEFVDGLPTDVLPYTMYSTPYSLLLGVDDDEAGVYRYDFETLPEIPDTADQIDYPPLVTNKKEQLQGVKELKIYPNPVSNELIIESTQNIQSLRLYDLTGKAMKHSQVNGIRVTLDMSGLDEGMYLLQVQGQNGMLDMHKIIKK